MKIKAIEIGAFGKFSNYTLTFQHPFQLIYGQNEDGKTTIMTFISMMFYSDQGRSQSIEQNPRKKYTPWSGLPMEGALTFHWKGGDYHLSKQFGDTPGRDKAILTNLTTQKDLPLNRGQEVGMKFFGLDLSGFQRSSFISQLGTIEPGRGTDQIAEKLLVNLVDTGDEDLSGQEAIQRLEKAKQDLVRPRAATGRLTLLEQEQSTLQGQRQQLVDMMEEQEENQQALRYAQRLLKEQQALEKQQKNTQVQAQAQGLKQLLHQAKQLEQEKKDLEKVGLSVTELEVLLLKAKSLLAEQETLSTGLVPLIKTLENSDQSVSLKELQDLEQLVERKEKAVALHGLWADQVEAGTLTLRDNRGAQEAIQAQLQEKASQLATIAPIVEGFASGEEKLTSLGLQEAEIHDRIQCDQRVYEQQEALRKEQLELYAPQLDKLNSPPSLLNIPLLVVGIVVILLGAALGYFVAPSLALLAGIGLVAILLAAPFRKGAVDTQEVAAVEDKMKQIEKELHKAKGEQERDLTQRRAQLDSIKKAKQEWTESRARAPELKEAYALLKEEETSLKQQSQQLDYHKQAVTDSLATLEETFSFLHLPQGLPHLTTNEVEQVSAQLKDNVLACEQKVDQLLESKSAPSPRAFEQKHYAFLSSQRRQEQVTEMEKELGDLGQQLLEKVAPLGTQNQAEIPLLLGSLEQDLLGYNKDANQLAATARAMGLPAPTVALLEAQLQALPLVDALELPTEEALKEGVLRLQELEEKGLLDEVQRLQKHLQTPPRSLEDVDLELANLHLQVNNMQDYYDSLSLALVAMEGAQEEMRSSFGPLVNEKTSEIFAQLTREKYDTLRVDQEYQIAVKEGVHFRPWGYLSGGTTDQAYLALRLAISQLIAPEEGALPLLLDDILIQYDDERAKGTLEFLLRYSRESDTQILLFSCHNRMVKLIEDLNAPYQSL